MGWTSSTHLQSTCFRFYVQFEQYLFLRYEVGWRWFKRCQPTSLKRFTHRLFKRFRWVGGLKWKNFNSKSVAWLCIYLHINPIASNTGRENVDHSEWERHSPPQSAILSHRLFCNRINMQINSLRSLGELESLKFKKSVELKSLYWKFLHKIL